MTAKALDTQIESLLTDLRCCHWEDYTDQAFDEIAQDLRRTVQKCGHIDYTMFPPTFRWHLCSSRLSQGKFDNWDGWEYRSNWSITFQGWNGFSLKIPKWNGKPVKKLIIAGEQGQGDDIVYGSAIPELMVRLGPQAIEFQCHPSLVPIFERSFGIRCTPRKILSEITEGDAVVALADLFMIYRRDKAHFPKKPFLKPNPDLVEKYRKIMEQYPRPWTGVAWGSRKGSVDPAKLVAGMSGTVFDLQYRLDSYSYPEKPQSVVSLDLDIASDKESEFAIVANLDKVVSVTQTLVHVAGSMGVPCDVIKPPKGTGEVNCQLWYYGIGQSPHSHMVYGNMRVYESLEEYGQL